MVLRMEPVRGASVLMLVAMEVEVHAACRAPYRFSIVESAGLSLQFKRVYASVVKRLDVPFISTRELARVLCSELSRHQLSEGKCPANCT
jgi:hypothetical protein